jgi:hypothetical protein
MRTRDLTLSCVRTHFDAQTINLVTLSLEAMVTGIGFCGRRGLRKRERQLRELSEHPERFHFHPPLRKRDRKLVITSKDGKKTIKRF